MRTRTPLHHIHTCPLTIAVVNAARARHHHVPTKNRHELTRARSVVTRRRARIAHRHRRCAATHTHTTIVITITQRMALRVAAGHQNSQISSRHNSTHAQAVAAAALGAPLSHTHITSHTLRYECVHFASNPYARTHRLNPHHHRITHRTQRAPAVP
jgi:hypothetical protein